MINARLSTDALTIGYPGTGRKQPPRVVARDLRLELGRGELVCLLGPNGAGKSTLLRTLGGMQTPLAGRVSLDGRDLSTFRPRDRARHLATVLTERIETGLMPVIDLVALGRHPHTGWSGRLTHADRRVVARALEQVDAGHLAARNLGDLSDGERQKVMIARALAQEPEVLLLDEPTAYLDLPRRAETMLVLASLAHRDGRAVLLSSHDLDLALRSADRLWLLPPGGPVRCGTPEDLALDGSLAETFGERVVRFDRQSGAFRLERPTRGHVALDGEGPAALWTRRALERIGLEVHPTQSAPSERVATVRVGTEGGWRLEQAHGSRVLSSVGALVDELRVDPSADA